MVLAPEKKVDLADNRPRPRGEIFNRKQAKPVNERFGFNPWTFISAFIIITIGFHAALAFFWKGAYDSTTFFSALAGAGLGYILASMLLTSAVETFQDSPLKQKALKQYHELRDLDVSAADAIKGTSQSLGLPIEQVRTWVDSNKGRLRVSGDK
jgi:hypothetical protein